MMSDQDIKMLQDMGFEGVKIEKALAETGNKGVEPALEWLLAHAGEEIVSEPVPVESLKLRAPNDEANEAAASTSEEKADATPKSLKCDECNKLFATQLEVEYHAAKSGHSSFSESVEEKKPLTEEEKKEQFRKIEEKLKQVRKEREEQEKKDALEREKMRIKSGKEIAAAKKRFQEEEMKKIADQKKQEKMEERIARQRVREQIEQDKIARRKKFGMEGANVEIPIEPKVEPVSSPPPAPRNYTETKLQIRLTNGQTLTQSFGAKEQLSAVRLFVEMNRTDMNGPFSLMTPFPRKVFTEEDYETPLDILGLVPSAVVIVAKPN
ncbi:hypothetical protein J437_LFUL004958 [Ladona fulva]|uniref:UBX domain-containing protein 1 n=1 Tax=Ladona fulva TaxID=123851 RepID=A0A8K0NSX7_LADFU|nr:hypothetical protein J437_LFUL004958 [Ladona fulva]